MTYTLEDAAADLAAEYCRNCDEWKTTCQEDECGETFCLFCEMTCNCGFDPYAEKV